jgi:hypothetical protein
LASTKVVASPPEEKLGVAIVAAAIYLMALAVFSILMWPIRKISQNADANPDRTAKTMIFLTSAILLINTFGLPWKFDVLFNGRSFASLLGQLGNASGEAFVFMVFFGLFFVFVGLPYLVLKFLFVAIVFSRQNTSTFWRLLFVGFAVAAVEYWIRGVVTLKFAVYGLGAFVIYNYYRVLSRN